MNLRERALAGLARQLAQPEGRVGELVGQALNRGNRRLVLEAVEAAGLGPGDTVADLGFGGGVGLRPLVQAVGPEGSVVAVDRSHTMIRAAKRRHRRAVAAGRLSVQHGDLTALPLTDRSLDAAITVHTVYFLPDLKLFFTEVARVVRPGGRVIVAFADFRTMGAMPVTRHGFILRPVQEVIGSLRAAGFWSVQGSRIDEADGAPHVLVAHC